MIEVLFDDSEAGGMKMATNRLAGGSKEVVCLNYMLDIGDISQDACSDYRAKLKYSLYMNHEWLKEDSADCELWTDGWEQMQRLKKHLAAGKKIRVWYSGSPYSICGFYHLCAILENYSNKIYVVKLPEYKRIGKTMIVHKSWGEVDPVYYQEYLAEERQITKTEICHFAECWKKLQKENGHLRAVVNGEVLSVPRNFYDHLIMNKVEKDPKTVARVIGDVIVDYWLGVSPVWYEYRINELIRQGEIEIVKDDLEVSGRRLVRKAQK